MINPLRSEQDAFRFTLFIAALAVPVIVAAVIWDAGVAAGVGGGLMLGVIAGIFLLRGPKEPQQKMLLGKPVEDRGSRKRILVISNQTLGGKALHNEITHRAKGHKAEVMVVCPALNSKLKHWTSDTDEARKHAQESLNQMLAGLVREGITAAGEVGDEDPMLSIEDALRRFSADEIIISTHPPGRSHWLERDVVARAREIVEIPINHVVVDLDHENPPEAR